MNILQVTEGIYPNSLDGISKHVHDLSSELVNQGHDVDSLVKTIHDKPEEPWGKGDARVKDSIIGHESLAQSLSMLQNGDYDIVHLHALGFRPIGFISNDAIITLSKLTDSSVVLTPHGAVDVLLSPPTVESNKYPVWAMKLYLKYLVYGPFRFVDRIVPLTPFQKREMVDTLNIPAEKARIIPNGIADSAFDKGDPQLFEREFDLQNCSTILYLGRVAPRKRVDEIVEVVPKLVERDPSIKLVIAGSDGGAYDKVEAAIQANNVEDHVVLCGRVSEEMKKSALAVADVFVNPSEFEGLPTAPLEAMAQRCPVVCAGNEGAKHLVKNGEFGLIYPIGDTDALIDQIQRVMFDGECREEFAKKGERRAEEYKWSSVAIDVIDMYNEIK